MSNPDMSERNNERRGYHLPCPTCNARSFNPCRSLTKGRVTDTHAARLALYRKRNLLWVTANSRFSNTGKIHKPWCSFAEGGSRQAYGEWMDFDAIPTKTALDSPIVDCRLCGGSGTRTHLS